MHLSTNVLGLAPVQVALLCAMESMLEQDLKGAFFPFVMISSIYKQKEMCVLFPFLSPMSTIVSN